MNSIYVLEKIPIEASGKQDIDVRERIVRFGPRALSDRELLIAIIGSGCQGKSVIQIANDILKLIDLGKSDLELDVMKKLLGVGDAKACAIAAAIELGRRFYSVRDRKISMPQDVFPLISHFADRKQEHFLVVSLNGAHEVNAVRHVSLGLVNKALIHPREVFADPIVDRACAVIVAHNHPSGNLEPSQEDIEITRRLRETGDILGIPVLDHLIFCEKTYYSFVEHRLIQPSTGL